MGNLLERKNTCDKFDAVDIDGTVSAVQYICDQNRVESEDFCSS